MAQRDIGNRPAVSDKKPDNGSMDVGSFFSRVSGQYDDTIQRTIPPYQEIFEAVLRYCPLDFSQPLNVLELGCGTGNLSLWVAHRLPQAQLTLVDLSPEMLEQTSHKLKAEKDRIRLVQGDFMGVDLPEGRFDLVVSSIALHHLPDEFKPGLYRRIHGWLKPGGYFRCADEVLTLPEDFGQAANLERWKAWSREKGATEQEIAMWVEHGEKYDHYAPLTQHFKWLEAAGFQDVDCYWRQVLWAVFGGRKP